MFQAPTRVCILIKEQISGRSWSISAEQQFPLEVIIVGGLLERGHVAVISSAY